MDFAIICIYFSADDYSKEYFRSLAIVSNDGTVFWAPPTKFRSTCSVDVMYFPFDDQSCNFKLSSWMYDGYKVGEKKYKMSISSTNIFAPSLQHYLTLLN